MSPTATARDATHKARHPAARILLTVLSALVMVLAGIAAQGSAAAAVVATSAPAASAPAASSAPADSQPAQNFRVGGAPTARSSSHPFFGHSLPHAGTTLHNVVLIPDKLLAKSIHVSSTSNPIAGNAVLEVGTGSHKKTIHTSFTWTSQCHWTFTVDYGASPGHEPAHPTGVSLNQVTGKIEAVDCVGHVYLKLHGYHLGDGTFDINLHATHNGFEGSVHVTDLVIGGIKYPTAKLSVSTLAPSARLEGTMETNSGTFTVDTYLTTKSGGYKQYLHITGSDLKLETKSAKITEFDVEKTFTAPTSGCAEFSATGDGKFRLKGKNYTLHQLHIKLSCGTLKAFKFHLTISHTDAIGVTKSGTLAVALLNEPGTTDELKGPGIQNDAIHYKQCLCGYVELTKKKNFERTYEGHEFDRSIKIGLVMGMAIYTDSGDNVHAMIGAGGYFSANRVSGSFGCTYHRSTFSCTGKIRVNPPWVGIRHYEYGMYI